MRAIDVSATPAPLFGSAAGRRIEQRALAAAPPHALMRRAGKSVARLALALAPHAQHVWIAAGPGNNGGDGLEAALTLHRAGKRVTVALHAGPGALAADAADALDRARTSGVTIAVTDVTAVPTLAPHDIAIDGLLGLGANRAPEGVIAELIRSFNALPCARLAIDLPSGLNPNTGQPLGAACVTASHTLALLTLKPGLFTGSGRDHAGHTWLDGLGVDVSADAPDAWLRGDDTHAAQRLHAQHKGSFGDVAVVGGAHGMTGAALLAARAALAAGAGRVFVNLLDERRGTPSHDALHPELMFRPDWCQSDVAVLGRSTVVFGCGGGDAVATVLSRLLEHAGRLLLDADALNAVAADVGLQAALRDRDDRAAPSVLTPHPLEAARLLGCSTAEVQADRLRAAQTLADDLRCVVVLKGSGSVIAAPDRVPTINATGNARLASAGTGDVLAGWIGGLWAPAVSAAQDCARATAFDTAARGVAAHGAAAEPIGGGPLRAGDLIERLHRRATGGAAA